MSIIASTKDQERLRKSGQILASLQFHLKNLIRPGLPASEIEQFALGFAAKYDSKLATLGYQGYKFGTCVSINQEIVHGLPLESKILPKNGLVSLDVMLEFEGLISDCSRTWVLGDPGDEALRLARQTREAMWSAIKKVKPGIRVGDLEAAMQKIAESQKLGNVTVLGGHGVGYEIHDEPMILSAGKAGKGAKIFENMAFTIEPMFTLGVSKVEFDRTKEDGWTVTTADDSLSAHEEHTILVTKKGYEVVTEIEESQVLPA